MANYLEATKNGVYQFGIPPRDPVNEFPHLITFPVITGDELGEFDGERYTAKYTGTRHVACNVDFASMTDGAWLSIYIVKNGASFRRTHSRAYGDSVPYTGGSQGCYIGLPVLLLNGDWLEFHVSQRSLAPQHVNGNTQHTWLHIEG